MTERLNRIFEKLYLSAITLTVIGGAVGTIALPTMLVHDESERKRALRLKI